MTEPATTNQIPENILSSHDEAIFNNYLIRNRSFVLQAKSKNSKTIEHTFPLYFGTTENEILPHRKMALRQKRLIKDPFYNTPKSLQNQNISKPKKIIQSNATPTSTTSKIQIQNKLETIKQKTDLKSESAQKLSTAEQLKQFKSTPSSTPSTATTQNRKQQKIDEKEKDVEKSNKPVIPTKTLAPSSAPVPSKQLTFAEQLKLASQPKTIPSTATNSTTQSTESSPSPILSKKQNDDSVESSKTNNSDSNASLVSDNSSTSIPQFTVSAEFAGGCPKPLGITLLRMMYDSEIIHQIFNSKDFFTIYPYGLANSGNICYMNSVLQLLFYCQPFSAMLNIIRNSTLKQIENTNSITPILNALLDLQDNFGISVNDSTNKNVINPEPFYRSIAKLSRFSNLSWGCQEDAEEFLNMLLDGLHEEFIESIKSLDMNDVIDFANAFNNRDISKKIIDQVDFIKDNKKDAASILDSSDSWNEVGANMKAVGRRSFQVKLSPIVTLFGGQFKSVLKVSNKKSSITLDPFLQVQLDISDIETNDLIVAFEKFSKDEEISLGSNMAKKQNFIAKLPSILLIQLKRFSFVSDDSNNENMEYEVVKNKKNKKHGNVKEFQPAFTDNNKFSGDFGRIEKIHKFIKYDHKLTLPISCISTIDVSKEPDYKLIGVIYHHGRSTENGHYTADVLTSSNGWIRLDDANIHKINANDAIKDQNIGTNINKTAYILMYQKVEN